MTRRLQYKIISMFGGTAGKLFGSALNTAFILTGTSAGNLIAKGIDKIDGNRNSGYVFD
ncbi:hypothetical protein [Clostridium sp. ZS2-4]|uniref:hypothetical protein n=1 Tax=Clostridium sp. ZS2-4 TaxID=2987703 RepID=UPI00227B5195|nr:hypothetical protein [Clostridium sp. ZS2-4]MCY6353778.1 hypothetical protein [Clostridium sp. ZS2-4]